MLILVLNCGSSSLKYQLIDMKDESVLAKGNFERIGDKASFITHKVNGEKYVINEPTKNHMDALKIVLEQLMHKEYGVIKDLSEIDAVGHRIVHGGENLKQSCIVTEDVVNEIERCISFAPLHNPAAVLGIRACQKLLPNAKMVTAFDTAFHQTMEEKAYIYNIPYKYYTEHSIRKYGAHGISHRYVANRIAEIDGRDNLRIINCHLGQGASLCAIKNGKCVDTTMGLTPLAGIPMGTRCGDIDPSIIPFIMKIDNLTPDEVSHVLNKESGALGVSGVSSDFRDVEEAASKGDKRAILALESNSYITAQYIAKLLVSLQGADYITFAGGIGENGIEARERLCKYLEFLGVKLDLKANNVRGEEKLISTPDSTIKLYIVPTNEEIMIARDTLELCK